MKKNKETHLDHAIELVSISMVTVATSHDCSRMFNLRFAVVSSESTWLSRRCILGPSIMSVSE